MILFTFRIFLLTLIIFSFLLVVSVPIVLGSPTLWENNKKTILYCSTAWFLLVLIIAILNYLVI